MPDNEISRVSPNGTALNAEHYQTFEMAKANDDVLASDNISQIRSYAAYARAQAQAIHKTIAATSGIDDVAAIKAEATETAQTFAKVGIYADQRIGEILRELPTRQGRRSDLTSSDTTDKVTRKQAIEESGIERSQAYDLQKMAANPEVVEAVIAKAEQDGRVVSRKQVLDAIKGKKDAERERDMANRELDAARQNLADAYRDGEMRDAEVAQLKRQLAERPKPEVVEREVVREVVPDDYEDTKRKVDSLRRENERLNNEYQDMWHKKQELDKKLDQANILLGEKDRTNNARRDIEALTSATNNYLRQYGGKAWAFDQFYRVDEATQAEFEKAISNLAAFSQNLFQMIKDHKQ